MVLKLAQSLVLIRQYSKKKVPIVIPNKSTVCHTEPPPEPEPEVDPVPKPVGTEPLKLKTCPWAKPQPKEFIPQPCEPKHGSYHTYKAVFFMLCLPLIVFLSIDNLMFSHKPERKEFIPYPYLRVRNKPFPWGDGNKSLFHNPETNALPDGYETKPDTDSAITEIEEEDA